MYSKKLTYINYNKGLLYMLPDEIYASSPSQKQAGEKFKYSHPLNHGPVDDGALRARLAYDLMNFMQNEDCQYFCNPLRQDFDPKDSDDEVDIMIVDGFYKEANLLVEARLSVNPNCEKAQFQKAFILYLRAEYEKLLERENKRLKTDPKNVDALINKGFALANLDREEEALFVANTVLSIDPDNLIALSNRANLADILGRDDLRDQTLAKAYNVCARAREEELREREARILEDMDSVFMEAPPSAFAAFNEHSGISLSNMVH